MAAEVLADDVEFHSIGTIVDRLKPLNEAVEASARKRIWSRSLTASS